MNEYNVEDFAKWLGLEPGKKYRFGNDNKEFTVSKFYNIYYDKKGTGISLSSFPLYQLLDIREVK